MENNPSDILAQWLQEAIRPVIRQELENILNERDTGTVPRHLTRDEVCSRLCISKATFHNWVRKGTLKVTKINGRVYVDGTSIDGILDGKETD